MAKKQPKRYDPNNMKPSDVENITSWRLWYIRKKGMKIGRAKMAKLLEITVINLAKYETRSAVPPELYQRICWETGFHPWFLIAGRVQFDHDWESRNSDLFTPEEVEALAGAAAYEAHQRRLNRDRKALDAANKSAAGHSHTTLAHHK